jgi:hypothetical protein
MSNLRFLGMVILFLGTQAVAETAPAPAPGSAPLTKRIPCDAFQKEDDGAWRPTRDVNVELPNRGVVTVDLAAVLERECRGG